MSEPPMDSKSDLSPKPSVGASPGLSRELGAAADCPNEQKICKLIDAHFRMRISPKDERTMRAQLSTCASCKAYYERELLLAQMDPKAPTARARLAAGLGLSVADKPLHPAPQSESGISNTGVRDERAWVPQWAPRWIPRWNPRWLQNINNLGLRGALGATAVAALALAIGFSDKTQRPQNPTTGAIDHSKDTSGFTARGAERLGAPAIFTYKVNPSGPEALGANETIRPNSELAFAYANPAGRDYLMIFAVDGAGDVHWYYPAWEDAAENPVAVAAHKSATPVRLRDAIQHDLDGQSITLFGLFADEPLTVRTVEQKLFAARKRETTANALNNAEKTGAKAPARQGPAQLGAIEAKLKESLGADLWSRTIGLQR